MKTSFFNALAVTFHKTLFTLTGCLFAISLFSQSNFSQPLSINTSGANPDPSAVLDVNSTEKGMLVPRMTTAQRTAIVAPASGLLVYDTDKFSFFFYNGFDWARIAPHEKISDTDNDTRIETEFNPDEDIIRFYTAGTYGMNLRKNASNIPRLEMVNTKGSVYLGEDAGRDMTFGERNTGLGYHALLGNTTGSRNIAIGWNTMFFNNTGNSNIAIGYYALSSNSIQSNLVAVGDSALYTNGAGKENTALGSKTLFKNSSGSQNTATGFQSMFNTTTGSQNSTYGWLSLTNNSNGSNNSAFGMNALYNNTTGMNNTGFGLKAVFTNTTGDNNTALGYNAYFTSTNLSNTTCIGYNSGGVSNVNNRIEIGNTSVTWIGGQVGWGTYSDARIKTDVTENVPGIAFISRLRPVTYHLDIHRQNELCFRGKKDPEAWEGKYDIEQKQMTGFIAQEVEAAAQAVGYDFSGVEKATDEVGLYSVRYAEFVVPLVKAVQEQQALIDDGKGKIAKLEAENLELKATLLACKSQLDTITSVLQQQGILPAK